MVRAAKTDLGLGAKDRLANDVADAYFIAKIGQRWWSFYEHDIQESDLNDKEKTMFLQTHTYTRGAKKGVTERKGIMYRENELYFLYDQLPYFMNF